MPSIKIAGKSKEDLVTIAQIAGLLTAEQAQSMTKVKLVKFLEQENARVEAAKTASVITDTPALEQARLPDAPAEQLAEPAESITPVVRKSRTATSRRKKSEPLSETAIADLAAAEVAEVTEAAETASQPKPAEPVAKRRTASRQRKPVQAAADADSPEHATQAPSTATSEEPAPDSKKKTAPRRRKAASAADVTEQTLPIESLVSQQTDTTDTSVPPTSETAATEIPEDAPTMKKTTVRKRRGPGRPRKKPAAAEVAEEQASAAEPAGIRDTPEDEQAVTVSSQPEPDQPVVQPAAPETVEESSPEAAEAATERDEPANGRKPAATGYSGRRPHSDFTGSMTRIPRSRIDRKSVV